MFFRRQDVIDQFAANFRDTPEGSIVFQPREDDLAVPVSPEEFDRVMASFERIQIVTQAITWVLLLGAGANGLYRLIMDDTYQPFFLGVAVAFLASFALSFLDFARPFRPFIERRNEMMLELERLDPNFRE